MAKKVGIFGGTFNPFHHGHLNCLVTIAERAGLVNVHVVPARQNPLKESVDGPTPEQRFEMVKVGLQDYPELVEVSDFEIKRDGPSYSIDTIEHFLANEPDSDLYLIIGMDSFEVFDRWKDFEKILEKVNLLVATRPGLQMPFSTKDLPPKMQEYVEDFDRQFVALKSGKSIEFIRLKDSEANATDIRKKLRTGRSVHKDIDIRVEEYIKENKLYQPVGPRIGDYEKFTHFCSERLFQRKAIDVKGYDLREVSAVSEFTLIGSGTSTRHCSSLATNLIEAVKEEYGVLPENLEGTKEGRWVLIDYGSLIVHLFYDYVRQEYRLEELWKEGEQLNLVDPFLDQKGS